MAFEKGRSEPLPTKVTTDIENSLKKSVKRRKDLLIEGVAKHFERRTFHEMPFELIEAINSVETNYYSYLCEGEHPVFYSIKLGLNAGNTIALEVACAVKLKEEYLARFVESLQAMATLRPRDAKSPLDCIHQGGEKMGMWVQGELGDVKLKSNIGHDRGQEYLTRNVICAAGYPIAIVESLMLQRAIQEHSGRIILDETIELADGISQDGNPWYDVADSE